MSRMRGPHVGGDLASLTAESREHQGKSGKTLGKLDGEVLDQVPLIKK